MRRNPLVTSVLAFVLAVLVSFTAFEFVERITAPTDEPALLSMIEAPLYAQGAGIHRTFTAQTATGATAALSMRAIMVSHSIGLVVAGGPSGCTYRLQGSRDGTTWFNISAADITCTSTTVAYEANKPWTHVRGNLLTLTGGTTPSVTLHYVGK